jgi:hypothetical protein
MNWFWMHKETVFFMADNNDWWKSKNYSINESINLFRFKVQCRLESIHRLHDQYFTFDSLSSRKNTRYPWQNYVERGGAVVECRPHDQEVVGSIPGQVTT